MKAKTYWFLSFFCAFVFLRLRDEKEAEKWEKEISGLGKRKS